MTTILLFILSLMFQSEATKALINVDSANCAEVQCYLIGEPTFRDASTIVGKYGTLKAQNDTALKLVSQYETTVKHMTERIQLGEKKSIVQDSLIKNKDRQVTRAKWVFGSIGVAVGMVISLVFAVVVG